jgi:hypothetical protein
MDVTGNPKPFFIRLASAAVLTLCLLRVLDAQDLAPRAYTITPTGGNAVTMTGSFYDGSIDFNGILPVTDAKGTFGVPILSYYHSFGIAGRSANVVAALPYGVGNFTGTELGVPQRLYRSGFLDSSYRFSVNLMGGPSMRPREFMKWRQKILLGASLRVVAPTGQYDPTKLVNWGANRWSFKPEFGYSQRWRSWVVDGYSGVWFFTTNQDYWSRNSYFPGTRTLTQKPVGALEGHLSYDLKPRLWISLDGNFYFGGTVSVAGVENPHTTQTASRIGATASIPITKHGSFKFSYSDGVFVAIGGNYNNVSIAWQYSWLGKPRFTKAKKPGTGASE